jgi:hypothetical protein
MDTDETRMQFFKARGADIFVDQQFKTNKSSVGATSWWPSAKTLDYVWDVVLQICHAYGVEVNREIHEPRERIRFNAKG